VTELDSEPLMELTEEQRGRIEAVPSVADLEAKHLGEERRPADLEAEALREALFGNG
jgi:hypothetical protein